MHKMFTIESDSLVRWSYHIQPYVLCMQLCVCALFFSFDSLYSRIPLFGLFDSMLSVLFFASLCLCTFLTHTLVQWVYAVLYAWWAAEMLLFWVDSKFEWWAKKPHCMYILHCTYNLQWLIFQMFLIRNIHFGMFSFSISKTCYAKRLFDQKYVHSCVPEVYWAPPSVFEMTVRYSNIDSSAVQLFPYIFPFSED